MCNAYTVLPKVGSKGPVALLSKEIGKLKSPLVRRMGQGVVVVANGAELQPNNDAMVLRAIVQQGDQQCPLGQFSIAGLVGGLEDLPLPGADFDLLRVGGESGSLEAGL